MRDEIDLSSEFSIQILFNELRKKWNRSVNDVRDTNFRLSDFSPVGGRTKMHTSVVGIKLKEMKKNLCPSRAKS